MPGKTPTLLLFSAKEGLYKHTLSLHLLCLIMQRHLCRSGLSPEFVKLAKAGHLEAWNLPLGASKLPSMSTHSSGLFCDVLLGSWLSSHLILA